MGAAGVHTMAPLKWQKVDTNHFCGLVFIVFIVYVFIEKEKILNDLNKNRNRKIESNNNSLNTLTTINTMIWYLYTDTMAQM